MKVTTAERAANVQKGDFDTVLLYAASNGTLFRPCCAADPRRDTVVFVRHKSGPTYYGYECPGATCRVVCNFTGPSRPDSGKGESFFQTR